LRPVAGRSQPQTETRPADVEIAKEAGAVLREFGGNRVAMAAEIVRLRVLLQDALYEISRLTAAHPPTMTAGPPAPGSATRRRPFGFG
jgi:hypothetical protein